VKSAVLRVYAGYAVTIIRRINADNKEAASQGGVFWTVI
jgi:hypothetical protein